MPGELPVMNFRVDQLISEESKSTTDKWRPLAWCSNLFQVMIVARGVTFRVAGVAELKVRVMRLGEGGREVGELDLAKCEAG